MMGRLARILIVLLLISATLPSLALAQNDTTDTAIPLTADNPTQSATLVGDSGGHVLFYRIDYAGASKPVTIDLTSTPGRDSTGFGFGFKVYGPNGLVGEAPVVQDSPGSSHLQLTLTSLAPGAYFIQVYNFNAGQSVDFTIQASGLTPAALPSSQPAAPSTPQPAPGTSVVEPIAISQPNASIAGSLAGAAGGAFQYQAFNYAGGAPATIQLNYSPPSPFTNGAVGFNLYLNGNWVGQGTETARDSNSATVSATINTDSGGQYTLQVFNYQPDFTATFVLNISGVAGAIATASGNTVPEKAIMLSSATTGASGTVNSMGDNYFLLVHPGGGQTLNVRLTAQGTGLFPKAVGFNLYNGSKLAGHADGSLNSAGDAWVASFALTDSSPTTYGLQVFNYSTTSPATYQLFVTGW